MVKKLKRSRIDRKIGGVIGGISDYAGISSKALRWSFIIITLVTMKTGIAVIAYLIALFIVPSEDTRDEEVYRSRSDRKKEKATRKAAERHIYQKKYTAESSIYSGKKQPTHRTPIGPSREFKFPTATFRSAAFEVKSGNITIQTWEKEEMNMQVSLSVHEKAHAIRQLNEEQLWDYFFQQTKLEINPDFLQFESKKDILKTDIIITVPNRLYEQVKIDLASGKLKYDQIAVEDAIIKIGYGEIRSRDAKGKFLNAEVCEGEIFFKQSEIENVEMTTERGDILLDGSFLTMIAKAEQGDVELMLQTDAATTTDLKAPKGNIRIQIPSTWNVDGTLGAKREKIKFDLKNAKIWDNADHTLVFTQNPEEISIATLEANVNTGIIKVIENNLK